MKFTELNFCKIQLYSKIGKMLRNLTPIHCLLPRFISRLRHSFCFSALLILGTEKIPLFVSKYDFLTLCHHFCASRGYNDVEIGSTGKIPCREASNACDALLLKSDALTCFNEHIDIGREAIRAVAS